MVNEAETTATVFQSTPSLQISAFVPGSTPWDRWKRRFEGALTIMKITYVTERKNYLLHYIGDAGYNVLYDNYGTQIDSKTYRVSPKIRPVLFSFFSSKPDLFLGEVLL